MATSNIKGFYAGSFDPFTKGHLEVIKQASKLFDILYVGIGVNPDKKRNYDQNKMRNAIAIDLTVNNINNVEVLVYEGLTAEKAKELDCSFLVRGIRNGMDYENEENLASVNQKLFNIDTIYIRAGELGIVSSSLVRELLKNNKNIEEFVPLYTHKLITNKKS